MSSDTELFHRCAEAITQASGLLITAGAGMGVDSGLADFRGAEGFWRAYPALQAEGLRFEEIANPKAFDTDPALAWGFYGHRLQRYRETTPHRGFTILQDIAAHLPDGAFVFTSNVDGHFQKAGFSPAAVCEVHGSIHHLQCASPCSTHIWATDGFEPVVDPRSCRLVSPLPTCLRCGALARPNILMFNDEAWQEGRSEVQAAHFEAWLQRADSPIVIELGAGKTIATIRRLGENLGFPLIRINLRDPDVGTAKHISVPMGALAALEGIEAAVRLFWNGK
jgi:NAD-dependent SIR2 family protein deacetylase